MAKMNQQLIVDILQLTGGAGNIRFFGHCMTRLRLTLHDDRLIQADKLKALPGVLGVINSDDQLQIVVGPGKAQTAAELMNALLAEDDGSTADSKGSGATGEGKKPSAVGEARGTAALAGDSKQNWQVDVSQCRRGDREGRCSQWRTLIYLLG